MIEETEWWYERGELDSQCWSDYSDYNCCNQTQEEDPGSLVQVVDEEAKVNKSSQHQTQSNRKWSNIASTSNQLNIEQGATSWRPQTQWKSDWVRNACKKSSWYDNRMIRYYCLINYLNKVLCWNCVCLVSESVLRLVWLKQTLLASLPRPQQSLENSPVSSSQFHSPTSAAAGLVISDDWLCWCFLTNTASQHNRYSNWGK